MPRNGAHNHLTRDIKPPGQCPGCDHRRAGPDSITVTRAQQEELDPIIGLVYSTYGTEAVGQVLAAYKLGRKHWQPKS